MIKIKVNYPNHDHSRGRGVGYYAKNLIKALLGLNLIEINDTNPDIIHYTFFDPFYHTLPNFFRTPTVVTVHDATPLVLENLYPQGIRAKINLALQKRSLYQAQAIITDSNNSKLDIIKHLSLPETKVNTVPLAVDSIFAKLVSGKQKQSVKTKYKLPDQFVFYIGGVNPNKNLIRFCQACQKLKLNLVFGGGEFTQVLENINHPELSDYRQLQKIIKTDSSIITTGSVSTGDLSAIYRLASLYCQPSLYEGFGLPLLEAMTAGCPIVSSNSGSLPEIYPTGTINFDPGNQSEIESAIKKELNLTEKDRENQIKAGKERAADFSWEKTAQETYAIYLSILTG